MPLFVCRSLLLALALLGSSLLPVDARASWDAAAGCIGEDRLLPGVERALGAPIDPRVELEGEVGGSPRRWRASVRVRVGGETRTRDLTSDASRCQALDDAVVVVTALLIDEALQAAPATPIAVPEPRSEPEAPRAPPAIAEPDAPDLGLAVRLAGLLRVDEVAGPSALTGLEVELRLGAHVAVSLGTYLVPPVEAGSLEGVSVRYLGAAARLGGCVGGSPLARLEVGGCGLGSASYLQAEARGLTETRGAEGASVLLSLEAWARLQLVGPLWVRLSAGLGVPLLRAQTVYLRGGVPETFHAAAWVIPELGLGLEFRLP